MNLVEYVDGIGDKEKIQISVLEYLDPGDLRSYCKRHPEQRIKLLTDVPEWDFLFA